MNSLRLYKKEKLCSLTAIERLFSPSAGGNNSIMAYPWRCVWRRRDADDRRPDCPQFVIVVPKRRLRHAVDRVRMRRLMREAYRLNRNAMPPDTAVDLAFIYVADRLTDFKAAEKSVKKIFTRLSMPSK